MTYRDQDFGIVRVNVNLRARSIIMRPEVDGLRVTVCPGASEEMVRKAIERFRASLLRKQQVLRERPRLDAQTLQQIRNEAKATLPRRVAELAKMHNFSYSKLTIRDSRTRWGSCSAHNAISLSMHLARVPEHLQDYVILHELCHTIHHDHSPRFWALMDDVTYGKAHALRAELRKCYIPPHETP